VFQIVDFSSINDLKFTYVRLQFQKIFSRGYTPDSHDKGEGRERRGGEGRREEERDGWDGVNPRKQILATALFIGKSLQPVGCKKMLILMFGMHKL
jgi:hypothetical protein